MKLFKTSDIPLIDKYTIENEPIADIDLMERAARSVVDFIINETNYSGNTLVFCGPGNNGGDGLAIARLLTNYEERFTVNVFILSFGKELTGSSAINLNRLKQQQKCNITNINSGNDFPEINVETFVIDALFGSGLNRPLEGIASTLLQHINHSSVKILAVDIPSGLMGEDNSHNDKKAIIKATNTVTFQFPKVSFLLPENEKFTGNFDVTDIGLHPKAISEIKSNLVLLTNSEIHCLLQKRNKFSHKGTFGHALLISGAYGKMGAAVLAAKACLRSGVGLLTAHIPHQGYQIIQTTIPEAMTSIDDSDIIFTNVDTTDRYNAIGIGPGIGTKPNTAKGLKALLEKTETPMVLDADAINILAENKSLLNSLPTNSILTPHPKEFERLTHPTANRYQQIELAKEFTKKHNLILVLKGAYTTIAESNGTISFNSTGNQGMATAGSGDVLTGIILALLAQNYTPSNAAKIGVYIHGLAGDIAAARRGYEALIASDIIENLGEAFKLVHK